MTVKYPDVLVTLTGEDGNAFAIIGRVSRALREQVGRDESDAFREEATSSGSYDELIQTAMRWVEVE